MVASVHERSQPVLVPGVRSLNEQCTSVIVCGLLKQLAPDTDQVPADYVPSTIKQFVASRYRAHKTPKINTGQCDRPPSVLRWNLQVLHCVLGKINVMFSITYLLSANLIKNLFQYKVSTEDAPWLITF